MYTNGSRGIEYLTDISNVVSIYSNKQAFAALKSDGTVASWGDSNYGGNGSDLSGIRDVVSIYSNNQAFTAVLKDGTIRRWGNQYYHETNKKKSNIIYVHSSGGAFAGLVKHDIQNIDLNIYTDEQKYYLFGNPFNRQFNYGHSIDFNQTSKINKKYDLVDNFTMFVPDQNNTIDLSNHDLSGQIVIPASPGERIIVNYGTIQTEYTYYDDRVYDVSGMKQVDKLKGPYIISNFKESSALDEKKNRLINKANGTLNFAKENFNDISNFKCSTLIAEAAENDAKKIMIMQNNIMILI